MNGQQRWEEAGAILRQGQATLLRNGSTHENVLAEALSEQLEIADRGMAHARVGQRG